MLTKSLLNVIVLGITFFCFSNNLTFIFCDLLILVTLYKEMCQFAQSHKGHRPFGRDNPVLMHPELGE